MRSEEDQIVMSAGAGPPAARRAPSRVRRIAINAAGYRHAAQVYGELANHARCMAETPSAMSEHYDRTQRHWLHWQRRCLRAADLHDQRKEPR